MPAPTKPTLAVDNEDIPKRIFERARRRVNKKNPNHTYDDVLAEAERLMDEEKADGERNK